MPQDTILFDSRTLLIGRFVCARGEARWGEENIIRGSCVVFPTVPVRIQHSGRDAVVADRNVVMYYNDGQTYRRGLMHERGDEAIWFALKDGLWGQVASETRQRAGDAPDSPFDNASGPSPARCYLRQGAIVRLLRQGARVDPLAVEEASIGIIRSLLAAQARAAGAKTTHASHRTACERRLIAEEVRELLAADPGADGSPIHELLADETGTSFGQFFVGGVGDFDRDGVPDVYVGDFADSRAYVFSGADGAQLFNHAGEPGEGLGCGRGAGDVNGDGHADLAVGAYTHNGGSGSGRVYIFSGCDGRVLRTITTARGTNEQLGFDAVGMADADGDGLPEIIGAAGAGNRVYIIRGNRHPIPDFNGGGAVNTRDVTAFLNAWTQGDERADYNLDGAVNTENVTAFLNAWVVGD